jgi:hypothetical protein
VVAVRPHWAAAEKEATMLRHKTILTTAAVLAVCAAPASADTYQDLRSPDAKDAAREAGAVTGPRQDLRSPDARDAAREAGTVTEPRQDLRSPDARDAARELPRVVVSPPAVEVREAPSGGFDWGDAGIGAAGALGLFSLAAGSALVVTGRRRRSALRVAAH